MKKLFLMIAFTGIVGASSANVFAAFSPASAITLNTDDKDKKKEKKACCKKDAAACDKEKAKACASVKKGCCKGKTTAAAPAPAATPAK